MALHFHHDHVHHVDVTYSVVTDAGLQSSRSNCLQAPFDVHGLHQFLHYKVKFPLLNGFEEGEFRLQLFVLKTPTHHFMM